MIYMKKLEICFETLDTDNTVVKNYEWSELYDEITNLFASLLGTPKINIEHYQETNEYLGTFNMKRKTLTYSVNWDKELITLNALKLGDNLDWNLKYNWID